VTELTTHTSLLLDAGNSRIKWAWHTAQGLRGLGNVARNEAGLNELCAASHAAYGHPIRVIVSNVAGQAFAQELTAHVIKLWGVQPEFPVAQPSAYGVNNGYSDPARLGTDRWAALIGARAAGNKASCIVDCGTAITVDTLTAQGEHLGGVIMPGLGMMHAALINNTEGISFQTTMQALDMLPFARDTAQAVGSGALYAAVAAIDRIARDITARLVIDSYLITGGNAEQIAPLLEKPYRHEPNLVLQGLAVIAGLAK